MEQRFEHTRAADWSELEKYEKQGFKLVCVDSQGFYCMKRPVEEYCEDCKGLTNFHNPWICECKK